MNTNIGIVDYGLGNLRSVQKAIARLGLDATITSEPEFHTKASAIVLPGVGSFEDGIQRLRITGLDRVVLDHLHAGKPLLGICLGLQLLFETGYEDGCHKGLGWFAGDVVRFKNQTGFKVPHMGWNTIQYAPGKNSFSGVPDESYFYFVHSYHVQPDDKDVIATYTDHGQRFVSSVRCGKVLATQFHPEKSQDQGVNLLDYFFGEVAGLPIRRGVNV